MCIFIDYSKYCKVQALGEQKQSTKYCQAPESVADKPKKSWKVGHGFPIIIISFCAQGHIGREITEIDHFHF